MQNKDQKLLQSRKLALTALFTAIVTVLAYTGGYIKIGGLASVNLTLIPVVLGGALCGPAAGAWLGAVASFLFLASFTPDVMFWYDLSVPGTIITVMLKGTAAGFGAGWVYKLLEKSNRYLAVMVSAIVCPTVNTGIFILGCLTFFMDYVKKLAGSGKATAVFMCIITVFVGLNFVLELAANVIAAPAILRLINIRKKTK